MPTGAEAGIEPVNAFPIDGIVLFKHYFDGDAVFDRLKPYYNGSQYRFEVPVDEFDSLRRFLRGKGWDVSIVDRPAEYWIVVRQFTTHPDGIFKDAVYETSTDGYNCFLLKNERAVQDAVASGATRLTAKPFSVRTGSLGEFAAPTA